MHSPPNPNPAILPARSGEMALPHSRESQKLQIGELLNVLPPTLQTPLSVPISFHLSRAMTSVLPDNLDIFIPLFYISDNLCLLMLPLSI